MDPARTCFCHFHTPRAAVRAGFGLGTLATLSAPGAQAAPGSAVYDSMLLSCIDPRMVDPVFRYMHRRGLDGRYSQFVFAGAAIGVEAPSFMAWRQTFWDNLAASIELHRISRVIAIDHQDCGGARIAYGADSIATPEAERRTHQLALTAFKAEVARRHPDLRVEGLLMSLQGAVERLA
jgi:carbonic anhydrase